MPMPNEGSEWPPAAFKPYLDAIATYDAHYVGDISRIETSHRALSHPAQWNGGIVGAGARALLGKPQPAGEHRTRLHIPLGPDIATLSADLLFGEAPRVVLPGERSENGDSTRDKQQARVEKVINTPRFHSLLLESGEIAAALGGTFLRLVWNKDLLKTVRAEAVHADAAIPTFRYGDLHEVLFWTDYPAAAGGSVWRHLELHTRGRIEHALFRGTALSLGRRVPLNEHQATRWLAGDPEKGEPALVDEQSGIDTNVEGLTAAYIPNMRPNKQFRKDAALARLGQSDFADIVQLFDAIDEVWSSWMRDVRLAKARIIIAQEYLESQGFGGGATADLDREVYEGVKALTGPNGEPFGIHMRQFDIRVTQHAETVKALRDQAMRSAGYSPGSVGGSEQGMRTATEIKSDERLSERTRDKKINYWKAGLEEFLLTWLQLDAAVYGHAAPDEAPEIRFPAEAQADQEAMARINQLLYAAQAASIETRVRMQHPEWEGKTVNDEVERIRTEYGIGQAADPTAIGAVSAQSEPTQDDIDRMRERMKNGEAAEDDE